MELELIICPVRNPCSVTGPCSSIVQTVHEDAGFDGAARPGHGGDSQLAIAEGGEELGVGAGGKDVSEEEPRIRPGLVFLVCTRCN